MPAATETPPVAPSAPQTPAPPPFDPTNPPPPQAPNPENDPNLLIQGMINRRKTKGTTDEKKEASKEVPVEAGLDGDKAAKNLEETGKAGDAIFKALGFTGKTLPTEKETPKEEKKPDKPGAEQATKPPKPGAEEETKPATIVSKKKPAPPAIDPVRIASEAATAATREAMKGFKQPETTKPATIEDSLTDDDRHEYEVVKYLSETDPKYKDAHKIVLSHVKKAAAYAAKWEQHNNGKVFDPEDEEHSEFFDALDDEKTWSSHDFRRAERKMESAPEVEEQVRPLKAEMVELRAATAKNELAPIITQTHIGAAAFLAKQAGDDVFKSITTDGFDKFAEKDPIAAEELSRAVSVLQPVIEAAIQIDDPQRRIPFDPKNEMHQEWLKFLHRKEADLAGTTDEHGRAFASRLEYSTMTAAQMERHYVLDTQRLVSELVSNASNATLERIKTEKERQKKIALSLGFIPKEQSPQKPSKTASANGETTKDDHEEEEGEENTVLKPESPSSGSGVKIDETDTGSRSGRSGMQAALHDVLFGR